MSRSCSCRTCSTPQKKWNDVFEGMLKRPGMYTGKKSIARLESLIAGFEIAEGVYGITNPVNDGLKEFERFVSKKYNRNSMSVRSFGLALLRSGNEEEKGFDLWLQWYDEFLKES